MNVLEKITRAADNDQWKWTHSVLQSSHTRVRFLRASKAILKTTGMHVKSEVLIEY